MPLASYILSLCLHVLVILIVWFCKDSVPGANEYGPNPKGIGAPEDPYPQQNDGQM